MTETNRYPISRRPTMPTTISSMDLHPFQGMCEQGAQSEQDDDDPQVDSVHHVRFLSSMASRPVLRRVKSNVLPLLSLLSTPTVPPCASTMSFTMARPNPTPVPGPCSGTRKNCSKIRGRYFSGIPIPVSETWIRTNSPSAFAVMEIVPPG